MINNNDLTNVPPYKRPVGFQFQSYALFPNLNVLQNLKYPLRNKASNNESLDQIIQQLNISNLLNRRVDKLSGGEQQRIALGRALISAIETNGILLLDEPVSALDEGLRESARIMIRELQKEFNLTTIFITHDSKDIVRMADGMAILDDGRIIQQGSIKDVSSNPASENAAISFGFRYIGNCISLNHHIEYAEKKFQTTNKTLENNTSYKCYLSNESLELTTNQLQNTLFGTIVNITETNSYFHYTIKLANQLIVYDCDKRVKEAFQINENVQVKINWESVIFYKIQEL